MARDDGYFEKIQTVPDLEFTIPAQETAREFNNVTVKKKGAFFQIRLTLMMEPRKDLSKVWKTAVALDASASMRSVYGRRLHGHIPDNVAREYEKSGWLKRANRDGRKIKVFTRQAAEDAIKRGLVSASPNIMDYLGPEFIRYLSGQLDVDDETTLIFWGGDNGNQLEAYGNVKKDQPDELFIDGPPTMMFGKRSFLLPAFKYLTEQFAQAPMSMLVFISDGQIGDLSELKKYTTDLAREIMNNRHNLVKCILVGVGDEIRETTLLELEAVASATCIGIWDYMMVNDLREVLQIFTEVISSSQIVASSAKIYDDQGNEVKAYSGGLPATVAFSMPSTSRWFELEIGNQRTRQLITVSKYALKGLFDEY
ncbi:MAG: hypothetical protein VB084_07755 [Syntrophomonadaceae bacterium]|nr:hypothetical protein [Syntrophomonadaceae bacterium]